MVNIKSLVSLVNEINDRTIEVFVLKIRAEHVKRVLPFIVAALFLVALNIFWREIRDMNMNDLRTAFSDIPNLLLLLSCLSVAFSYWLMTIIEKYAVAESGLSLTYPKIARISFISRAVGAAAGVLISGTSFRYRYFSRAGADPVQIARIVGVTQVLAWAGSSLLSGLALLLWPADITELIGIPVILRYLLALGCIALPSFLTLVSFVVKSGKTITIYGRAIPVPKPEIMTRQLLAGFFIPLTTALSLYFLLPESHGVNFLVFCGVFTLSSMVSVLSMVPGGIGIFDASLIWMLRPFYVGPELLSALLLYRLFNNLAPFAIASVFVIFDSFRPRHLIKRKR